VRKLVNSDISKIHLINGFLIVLAVELLLFFNVVHSELLNDFLDIVLQKSFEGKYLLSDKTVLLEVTINNFPRIVLIDRIHIGSIRHLSISLHFDN